LAFCPNLRTLSIFATKGRHRIMIIEIKILKIFVLHNKEAKLLFAVFDHENAEIVF